MTPTKNQISIQYLVARYRYKHKDDQDAIDKLERILWYSYPIVYPDAFDECSSLRQAQRTIDARKRKKNRYNKRIKEMVESYDELIFLTLTFTDEVISSTSENTRKRYVQRWLNENCRDYLANEDFGKQNGRQHFHAVVAFNKSGVQKWEYGFEKRQKIRFNEEDRSTYRISGYLLKIANHGGKLGTGKSFSKRGLKEVDNLPF